MRRYLRRRRAESSLPGARLRLAVLSRRYHALTLVRVSMQEVVRKWRLDERADDIAEFVAGGSTSLPSVDAFAGHFGAPRTAAHSMGAPATRA